MRDIARVIGTIEFADGTKVEFGLGADEDWRNGPNAGRAVDACESIRNGLQDDEHFAYDEEEHEARIEASIEEHDRQMDAEHGF